MAQQPAAQAPAAEAQRLSRKITQVASGIQSAQNRQRIINQARRLATQASTSTKPAEQDAAVAGLEMTLQQAHEELRLQRPGVGERLEQSHLIRRSGREKTFADLLITLGASTVTVLWTASRNHDTGSDILWAIFWSGFGSVMAVEGTGELAYAGFGVAGADMAYLVLRLVGGITPKVL